MQKQIVGIGISFLSLILPLRATAATFNQIYVFGDSLSDVGNVNDATFGIVPPGLLGYDDGRFSNGPVWVEYLAQNLGLSSNSDTNFAFGGATTGRKNVINSSLPFFLPDLPGLQQQIEDFTAESSSANADGLYIVWAGGNDYLGGGVTDPSVSVNNLSSAVQSLFNIGARNFLVPNLPDLGRTPSSLDKGIETVNTRNALSATHNSLLDVTLSGLRQSLTGINLVSLDVDSLFDRILATPAEFSFTNVTESCLKTRFILFSICDNPNEYLFWDGIHPTTAGHQLVGQLAFSTLSTVPTPVPVLEATSSASLRQLTANQSEPTSVPEPTSSVSFGVLGVAWLLHRRFRKSSQKAAEAGRQI